MLTANLPRVPAWVVENYPHAFSAPAQGSRTSPSDAFLSIKRTAPGALYLLDGPTFPVGDGGSWLKARVLAALAGAADGVVAIAPQLGADDESQYEQIGVPVIWLDAAQYYGEALTGLLTGSARWVFTDSLETAARTSHSDPLLKGAVLMMDDYASTGRRERIGHSTASRTRLVQQVLEGSSLSIWRSRQDAAPYTNLSERSLVIDGIEHSDEVETSPEGPVAMLANFMYPPNRAAAKYLIGLDWGPRRLKLIGRIDRSLRKDAESLGHACTGLVPDPSQELRGCCAGVDPVMEGSGLSTKLGTYISVGLPALGTRTAVRGIAPELVRLLTVVDRPSQIPVQTATWDYTRIRSAAKEARSYARGNLNLEKQLGRLVEVISGASRPCA